MALGNRAAHNNMAEPTALTSSGHIPTPAYGQWRGEFDLVNTAPVWAEISGMKMCQFSRAQTTGVL